MFDNSNDPGRHPSSPVADNKVNNNGERNPPAKNVDIYVMPSKFLPNKRPATKAGRGAKIIIFALTFTLILGAVVAGALWYLNKNLPARPGANNVALTDDTNARENINQPPTNDLTNQLANDNAAQVTNQISNNDNSITNDADQPPVANEQNLDLDGDGLTIDEEALFLTNVAKNDSDRDGYSDGQEVINLFNPLVPGQNLENSGLVTRYRNLNFKYSLLIPQAWLPSPANAEASEVILLSNSESGEFITVQAALNGDQQSLEDLASSYFTSGEQPENYSLAGQPALRSKTRALSVVASIIYVIDYQYNTSSSVHFYSVYEMILKSWELIKNEVEIQS